MSKSKINIALFFGGRSAEHEVSLLSARSVYDAFDKNKYNIFPVAITQNGYFINLNESKKILNSDLEKVPTTKRKNILPENLINFLESEIDLAFPVLHGPYGEDGKIQGFLDTLNINYIGCNLCSSAVGMDKAIMKEIFAYHNIPQSEFKILRKHEYHNTNLKELFQKYIQCLELPFFIKPANMGSSIGISRINNFSSFKAGLIEAFNYDNKLVIESNVEAREIESAVMGFGSEIKVSAAGEIISKHDFYDYQAKYKDQSTDLIIPAKLSKKTQQKVKELSLRAFNALGAEGISRLDFFVNENQNMVLVNEINTMPGFTEFSMYPLLFEEIGISYSDLLDELVDFSIRKSK